MNLPDLSCKEERRREEVRAASLFGLDYAEFSDDPPTVTVHYLGKAPPGIEKTNILLRGGTRIRDVEVVNLHMHHQTDPTLDDYMEVVVDKLGDFSTYTLSVVTLDEHGHPTTQPLAGFDPRYDRVDFNFKASCPTDLDCKVQPVCPPPKRTQPEINYLAKDYASFRQLILDRLAIIMPNWQETHVPDLGIALVELLAYTGDYLSYHQDAVATEMYLDTARERISVRRHARLVDYALHEGCNARAWVTMETDRDQRFDPRQIYFITSYPGAPAGHVLESSVLESVPATGYEVFEPLWPAGSSILIYAAHDEICFYTWGDCRCCLPKGATSATLIDHWVKPAGTGGPDNGDSKPPADKKSLANPPSGETTPTAARASSPAVRAAAVNIPAGDGPPGTTRALQLKPGDVLIFEEVIGPKTGNKADKDPRHRQAVRLTKVTSSVDPLYHPDPANPNFGQPIVEIEWAPQDALTFPLCISAQAPPHPPVPGPDPCTCMENVSVARGNVVLVDHGASGQEGIGIVPTLSTTERCPTACDPAEVEILPGLFRPTLEGTPLTFSQAIPPGACSAAEMIVQDPRQALPFIRLQSIPPAPECVPGATPPCSIPPLFTLGDLADPSGLAATLKKASDVNARFLVARLSPATQQQLTAWDGTSPLPDGLKAALQADLGEWLETWTPVRDLLESSPADRSFVVEMGNDGNAHIRFGDGYLGRVPAAGTAFAALRRLGNGTTGNVGAESVTYIVLRDIHLSGVNINPRNPLPATGGTEAEPLAEAKMFAPYAFRDVLERAITADDYAGLASDNARRQEERYAAVTAADPQTDICLSPFRPLQAAKASLRWTGSWYEALVAIDPAGTEAAETALVEEITDYLEPYRRMGHDLEVKPARYVPLDLGLTVCVLPDYLRGQVEADLLDVFSNRVLPDGTLGFFHPDNLTFGEGIYVSKIVAAAQSVAGVQNVQVERLERYEPGAPLPGAELRISQNVIDSVIRAKLNPLPSIQPEILQPRFFAQGVIEELPVSGVLALGPLEIARLDNDPDFPENGRLTLDLRGGR